jgi:hypothetical protein
MSAQIYNASGDYEGVTIHVVQQDTMEPKQEYSFEIPTNTENLGRYVITMSSDR